MDRWTTEETEDGFRLNYSEDFSVYAYADAAALEEIKDAHNAERDRLAAENAELRKWKADLEAKIAAASKIGMEFGEMEFDAWFPGSRPKTRKELTAELAAATHQIESLANQCQFQAERLVTLDAENAELRQEIVYWKKSCIGNSADLAAANATLDRLREVVNKWMKFDGFTAYDVMDAIRPILYPTAGERQ